MDIYMGLRCLIVQSLHIFQVGNRICLGIFDGYVIEYSLSVDNIFVFILIFSSFSIPAEYQHKVLFWGIIGALVMRAIFILPVSP